MNLDTTQKRILCSRILLETYFPYFELFKSSLGLYVIIKVWIVKILSKFRSK